MSRLIDPREQVERAIHEREGIVTPRALRDQQDELARFRDTAPRFLTCETLIFYRANMGDTGDAAYQLRAGTPSSDSAWAMAVLALDVPDQARILVVRLWTSEAVTAGTITARVRVLEGSDTTTYDFAECELNTTDTRAKTARIPWALATVIAQGATIEARAVTAGLTPTTLDLGMAITLGYEDWD